MFRLKSKYNYLSAQQALKDSIRDAAERYPIDPEQAVSVFEEHFYERFDPPPVEKSLRCDYCGHDWCIDCRESQWGIAQIRGYVCCECNQQGSIEVWRSGKR